MTRLPMVVIAATLGFAAAASASDQELAIGLGRLIGAFETTRQHNAPERFAPTRLAAVAQKLTALRAEAARGLRRGRMRPVLRSELPALAKEIEELRAECDAAAEVPRAALRTRLERALPRASDGVSRGILAAEASHALLAEARSALAAPPVDYRTDLASYDQQLATYQRLANALEDFARDPCAQAFGEAAVAREYGRVSRARALFAALAERECLDAGITAESRRAVAELTAAEPASVVPAAPAPEPAVATVPVRQTEQAAPARLPGTSTTEMLTLDVWQSAWGDFAGFGALPERLRTAGITGVNLNPGLAISDGGWPRAHAVLAPLVRTLRAGGVKRVNYLYAELTTPIGNVARFVRSHPDLGIDTIVDDSEFVDSHREQFAANLRAVRAAGLSYAAFVTIEGRGNSGVSDGSRAWALDNLDQCILMSYISCTVEAQREQLEPWLSRVDESGRRGTVRIALLLGSKSVGREVSCEHRLGAAGLRRFIDELDAWARQHPSYGGIVLETNEKWPAGF